MRWSISLILLLAAWPLAAGWRETVTAAGLDPARVTMLTGAAEGFTPGAETVEVRSVVDRIDPRMQIIWEKPVRLPRYQVPERATVFTRERWTGAPLAAGYREGDGIVFWTATDPGGHGFERFPYLPQALLELGLRPLAATRSLWSFFDSSYRLRADPGYLAARWRRGGVQALHIAAWHYWEPDPDRDAWLARLIDACHRHAITAYAWIEFPHVSERFWLDHPEWREKTAAGQDAHLDWRKLMNLADPACSRAIEEGLQSLVARFDWDGVNLGELYFESLEGAANPARFTPFNPTVLGLFEAESGQKASRILDPAHPGTLKSFLDFRAGLAHRMQADWLARAAGLREKKPWLDLAFTHVDDRFDQTMREKLGADAARLLPVAARHGATFLVEDPATIWHLGPSRYEELARRYAPLTAKGQSIAVDINVVERYQDVYPTKHITGGELFETLRSAARAFPRVAVYFENSITAADWPLVASAATPARVGPNEGGGLTVDSPQPVEVAWTGCALLDGRPWPAGGAGAVLVPAGRHALMPCAADALSAAPLRLADLNGDILDLRAEGEALLLTYESSSRAIALLARGAVTAARILPRGRHTVRLE
jgi:hypothetical protein